MTGSASRSALGGSSLIEIHGPEYGTSISGSREERGSRCIVGQCQNWVTGSRSRRLAAAVNCQVTQLVRGVTVGVVGSDSRITVSCSGDIT